MCRVTVVMPVYNGEKYLREAIESIINQTFLDWELLIINEFGSNEITTNILHEYEAKDTRIKVIQNQERLRISASINVGIDMAKGKYIARMDSDDISSPFRFKEQVEFLDNHPEIGIVGIKPTIFGEENWEWNAENDTEQVKSDSMFYLPCLHPTVMMRTEILNKYKLRYNPEYFCTEDYDFFERAIQYTKVSNILDKNLFKYRRYSTAATYAHINIGNEIYKAVMKRAFIRLGLYFTDEELSLLCIHEGINNLTGQDVEKELIKLDLLLKKILFANEKVNIYTRKNLSHTLHKRFKEAYDTLSWKCKKYNEEKAQIWYQKSIFSNQYFYTPISIEDKMPEVSVIMPTFNSEDYVADTIWSVLNQTYKNFELLVINEYGSNDDTVLVAKMFNDPRIHIIQNDRKLGLADSLNYGFSVARGKYLARVDADDIYSPLRFEKQVKFLNENPEYGVCGTWQHHFGINIDWNHCPSVKHEDLKAEFIFNCELCHSTLMLRKEFFIDNRLFYDKTKHAEDYELWTRAIDVVKFTNIPEILSEYRVGENNITAKKMDALQKESGKITADIIRRNLNIIIPKEHIKYMGGWKNEFVNCENKKLKKIIVGEEKDILEKMIKSNSILLFYNSESLKKVVNKRLEWITQDNLISCIKSVKKRDISNKNLYKKAIKRLLRPLGKLRNKFLNKIQMQLWDLDGHLGDYYNQLNYSIVEQRKQLDSCYNYIQEQKDIIYDLISKNESLINKIQEVEESLNHKVQEVGESLNHKVEDSQKQILQIVDARIWKEECNILNSMNYQMKDVMLLNSILHADKRVLIFGIPYHSNMGDQAQAYCIHKWAKDNYTEHKVFEICADPKRVDEYRSLLSKIKSVLGVNDKIILCSGYHLTDNYMNEYHLFLAVIQIFYDFKITCFPQSINIESEVCREYAIDIINKKTDLVILAREGYSYEQAKVMFNHNKVIMIPDVVHSLIGRIESKKYDRQGLIVCKRSLDRELLITEDELDVWLREVETEYQNIEIIDTNIDISTECIENNRELYINEIVDKMSQFEIVITDRLHGLIFALISNTPVIVLPTKGPKVKSAVSLYKTIPEFKEYVFECNSVQELPALINQIKRKKYSYKLSDYFATTYFDNIEDLLGNKKYFSN